MVPRAHGGACVTQGGPGIRKQGQCQVLLYSLCMAQFHQSPLALQVPESSSWMVQSACRENAMQKWLECALGELQPTLVLQTQAFYASRTYSGTHWAFRLLVCSCEFYSCFSSSLGTWREPCHQHPRGSRQPATGISSSHNWYELFLIYTHYVLALYTVTCPCPCDFIQDTATSQEINEKTHRKKIM